jgi:hypothetical protein
MTKSTAMVAHRVYPQLAKLGCQLTLIKRLAAQINEQRAKATHFPQLGLVPAILDTTAPRLSQMGPGTVKPHVKRTTSVVATQGR